MSRTPGRVLYVDDDDGNRAVFDICMRGVLDTRSVATAGEALAALEADPSVLVLLADLRMPEMSGLKLCVAVRERHPAVRCVLVSAYAQEVLVRGALTAGMIDLFLPKPLKMPELMDLLSHELRKAA